MILAVHIFPASKNFLYIYNNVEMSDFQLPSFYTLLYKSNRCIPKKLLLVSYPKLGFLYELTLPRVGANKTTKHYVTSLMNLNSGAIWNIFWYIYIYLAVL